MKKVEPIKSKEDMRKLSKSLSKNVRNEMLFKFGCSTALRVSDILKVKVSDVKGKDYIELIETKTKKNRKFKMNNYIKQELKQYVNGMNDDEYLFKSREGSNKPITRQTAWNVLKKASEDAGIKANIGTHSLRKTYATALYEQTKDIALLQSILNHSSPETTRRYLGIDQQVMDDITSEFNPF